MLPISLTDKPGFRNFVSVVSPGYVPPSRNTLVQHIAAAYQQKQAALKLLIHQEAAFASYTTDLWKSAAKEYYISVGLHFIDTHWKLHCPIIATTKVLGIFFVLFSLCNLPLLRLNITYFFVGRHTKDRIGELVASIISPFLGPNTKIHSGVTDGGEITSVKFTMTSLKVTEIYNDYLEERLCICHQLNNAIKRCLTLYTEPFLESWRTFVSMINYSNPFYEFFVECKKVMMPNSRAKERLQKDCETRYGSFLPWFCHY